MAEPGDIKCQLCFSLRRKTKSVVKRTSKNSCKNSADPGQFVEHVQHNVGTFHTYAKDTKASVSCTGPSMLAVDQNIQVKLSSVDESTISDRPEITIEDIQSSDTQIQFYTGLPDFSTFMALFDCLIEHGADKFIIDNNLRTATGKRKLRLIDEFLMVMMRLRLGLLLKDLEYRFGISTSRISRIFSAWITFICKCLQSIVYLPKLDDITKVPKCFENFSDTRIILDCTELFVQTPSLLHTQSQTYSNYKSHNTFKALVGINKTGAVTFISRLWEGSASDTEITRKSGLYDLLQPGDAVMVDKGFIHIKNDLEQRGVKLYYPPFLSKNQLSKSEVEQTRRIASARIHVERKMEQIKNFRILQGILPLSLGHIVDEIFFICAALTNLLPPLVK